MSSASAGQSSSINRLKGECRGCEVLFCGGIVVATLRFRGIFDMGHHLSSLGIKSTIVPTSERLKKIWGFWATSHQS
jgi:hypothetical protein